MNRESGRDVRWAPLIALPVVLWLLAGYGANSFWLAADEGAYADCAWRVLQGQMPHRDFLLNRPGADLWVNALAFQVAGAKLSSLRWPVLILAVLQTMFVARLLRPLGLAVTVLGIFWVTALGLPAVPSPSSSLYSNFFVLAALAVASIERPWKRPRWLLLLGALWGLAFCCRQLAAVFLGCGLLGWALSQRELEDREDPSWVARGFLLLSALVLTWYGTGRSDLYGILFFGLPPALLAWRAFWLARPSRALCGPILAWTALGFVGAAVPLALFYAWQGVLVAWLRDIVVTSGSFLKLGFAANFLLSDILRDVLRAVPLIRTPLSLLQLATWLALLFLPAVLAGYCWKKGADVPVYVYSGPFLALAALHLEIAIYLFWALPVAALGGVYLLTRVSRPGGLAPVVGGLLLVGFFNSAVGKPVWTRDQRDFVLTPWGGRERLVYLGGGADLWLPPAVAQFYARTVALVQSESRPGEPILSFPYSPEWYVLCDRPNPTPYAAPGLSLTDPTSLRSYEMGIEQSRPAVILFRRTDKYNTPYTFQLREWLERDYRLLRQENGYEILRRKTPQALI